MKDEALSLLKDDLMAELSNVALISSNTKFKLAEGLKAFIEAKNNIDQIENEIQSHIMLNAKNLGFYTNSDVQKYGESLKELLKIIDSHKNLYKPGNGNSLNN